MPHITSIPLILERDAPFEEVRTRLDRDHSKADKDEPEKYFHESTFATHYDGRFANTWLRSEERYKNLVFLMQTYLSAMNDLGVETFIMHGSLLGWYWDRRILPWDDDVDVMVTEKSMHHLAAFYNMTLYRFRLPDIRMSREYLLEINPHYIESDLGDRANVIDARWIDTETGLFIDITTLRTNETAKSSGVEGTMMAKDRHHYLYDGIFPLRDSTFERFAVKVPYSYPDLLVEEYGVHALTDVKYRDHKFDTQKQEWIALGLVRSHAPDLYELREP